jgi:hypothetical protein
MASHAVQSLVNADGFVRGRVVPPGGKKKDFFAGHDAAFQVHREQLLQQVNAIGESLKNDPNGGVAYMKIALQRSALAKSHRPVQSIFPEARTPVVGTEDVGRLIVEVTPGTLAAVAGAVASAEDTPRVRENQRTHELEPRPSRARSEVGAIQQLTLWGPSDRRDFSAAQAVDWLSDPRTGGGYVVELFALPRSSLAMDALTVRRQAMFRTFVEGLRRLGPGVRAEPLDADTSGRAMLFVRFGQTDTPPYVQLVSSSARRVSERLSAVDLQRERHQSLLEFLDHHPLVRSITLPPKVVRATTAIRGVGTPFAIPACGPGPYARVGVIDGGISGVLNPWVLDRHGLLADEDRNEPHGSFIGGLLVCGATANPHCEMEPVGCELVDVDVFPVENAFAQYYQMGTSSFFDELEDAIVKARTTHGVRVFNMSLNLTSPARLKTYDYYAARLDQIADRHDVIIVLSAGNLDANNARDEWTDDNSVNLAHLALARDDMILSPAESVRHISVAALNPPSHGGCVAHAPAAYSRRGPGLRTGVKPDLAHIGGALARDAVGGHGLFSLLPSGHLESSCGTSYAAPLVARTLAQLDASIEGDTKRETLLALLVHSARVPAPLTDKALTSVARDLVGFGMPANAADILQTNDHEITLVFESRILPNTEMSFQFAWPSSLVSADGTCRGSARVTLVARPPLDVRHGAEFVRVNLDAKLQQEHKEAWKGRLTPTFLPEGASDGLEKDRIEHALKWGPVKTYQGRFPKGVGASSNWRVQVEYIARALETMPPEGVPFTLVLTIADLAAAAPVFSELRQGLRTQGVALSDIRTAVRLRPRA